MGITGFSFGEIFQQSTDEAIYNHNYQGMTDADSGLLQWKAETPQHKRVRESRGGIDPAAKLMKNAVAGATRGSGVGSEARNEGFETLKEWEDSQAIPQESAALVDAFLVAWRPNWNFQQDTADRYAKQVKLMFRRGWLNSHDELLSIDLTETFQKQSSPLSEKYRCDLTAALQAIRTFASRMNICI